MHTESREPRAGDDVRLERAIVLQLLRDDHPKNWSRAELASEMDVEMAAVETALSRLHAEGVLRLENDEVSASPAMWRLDELELISI